MATSKTPKPPKPTFEELLTQFARFTPKMGGWQDTLKTVPPEFFQEMEAQVYSKVPTEDRRSSLTWTQYIKPKPWVKAWVRTFQPQKISDKRCAELGASPLMQVVERLEFTNLFRDNFLSDEGIEALCAGPEMAKSPLKQLYISRYSPKQLTPHSGIAIAQALGQKLQAMELDEASMLGVLTSGLPFPELRKLRLYLRDPETIRQLLAWSALRQIKHLELNTKGEVDELSLGLFPVLEHLITDENIAIQILPQAPKLQFLHISEGNRIFDFLATHPTLCPHSLSCSLWHPGALADYLRSPAAAELHSLKLESRRLPSDVLEALLVTPARFEYLEFTAYSDTDLERLKTAGIANDIKAHSAYWPKLDSSLQYMLTQHARVYNNESIVGKPPIDESYLTNLQELALDDDSLAHDAFHLEIKGGVNWRPVHRLEGIEAAKKLNFLNLRNCQVDDLSPLAACPLDTLLLTRNPVRSLRPLHAMHTLTLLDLVGTDVRDLSPIVDLPALQELNVSGCHLGEDQAPLLEKLRARGVKIREGKNP